MSEESREVAAFLKQNPNLLKQKKENPYEISENTMESFVYVDSSPQYLANSTPKQYMRKVRHLWVIK